MNYLWKLTTLLALLFAYAFAYFHRQEPRREFFYVGGEYVNLTVCSALAKVRHVLIDCPGWKHIGPIYDQPNICRKTYTAYGRQETSNRLHTWLRTNSNKFPRYT